MARSVAGNAGLTAMFCGMTSQTPEAARRGAAWPCSP
jgi:hypothetical protein